MSWSRRKFLAALAATAAVQLAGGGLAFTRAHGRVIVIGAGIAGLAAAQRLRAAGIDVLILEARRRIGGRIWSVPFAGGVADLGASWIHGTRGNPIAEIARRGGIRTVPTNYDSYTIFSRTGTGRPVPRSVRDAAEAASSMFFNELATAQHKADLFSQLATLYEKFLSTHDFDTFTRETFQWLIGTETTLEYASDLDHLSLLYWNKGGWFGGPEVTFPRGYAQIVRQLARGLAVRIGAKVTAVEKAGSGVRVLTKTETFKGDAVVVTLPLGVLQAHRVRFEIGMPQGKRDAIARLAMGTMDKVLLEFPHRFWKKRLEYFGVGVDAPGRAMNFWDFRENSIQPVLTVLCGGSFAQGLEHAGKRAMVDAAMAQLEAAFGSVPRPRATRTTRWNRDPFSLGSYSHLPPGASPADQRTLAEPVGGRVFYAGEATSTRFYSTVHGAYKSGVRAANEVIGTLS